MIHPLSYQEVLVKNIVTRPNTRNQLLCLSGGPIFLFLFFLGFAGFAGFIPPPTPSQSAAEVAQNYRDNHVSILIGMTLIMFAAAFTAPWTAVISTQLKRIEGPSAAMSYTQLGAGMAGILLFLIPITFWIVAAFRPERPDATQQLLNDLAWVPFIIMVSCFFIQCLAIALAIFSDDGSKPVYPRWVAYANLWIAFLAIPGVLAAFFKRGAFAWNGVGTWWLLIVIFTGWFFVMGASTYRAIRAEAAEFAAEHPHEAESATSPASVAGN
jgi:Mn2+/Fe2+ NRAMP family transporter